MTMSDFEDPRQLFKCSVADCDHDRAGNTPLCARHLRQQEVDAGRTSISEPALEARLATIRTEDDDHPGKIKIYDKETGEASWVPDPDAAIHPVGMPPAELYVGPDPDTSFPTTATDTNNCSPVAPAHPTGTGTDTATAGCWVTYHADWSGFTLHPDEMTALRHAVANHMNIRWATWGQQLGGGRYPEEPPAEQNPPRNEDGRGVEGAREVEGPGGTRPC